MKNTMKSHSGSTPGGFALVVLLIMVAAAGAAAAGYIASRARPEHPGKIRAATAAVTLVADAAEESYMRSGAFPATLAAALQVAGRTLARAGVDPFTSSSLDYRMVGLNPCRVVVRSTGPDRQLGTGDDIQKTVNEQVVGRARTYPRLRILRALYFRSPLYASGLSAAAKTSLLGARRTYTRAQRELLYHNDAAHRALLSTAKADLTNLVDSVVALLLGGPTISSITGPGGLLEQLGLPDSLGTDGFGNTLFYASTVGFMCAGGDRLAGNDDDF
jgi:hypothetical protein